MSQGIKNHGSSGIAVVPALMQSTRNLPSYLLEVRWSFAVVEAALLDLDRPPPLGALGPQALDSDGRQGCNSIDI